MIKIALLFPVKAGLAEYVAVLELIVPAQMISKTEINYFMNSVSKNLNSSVITGMNITTGEFTTPIFQ